MTKPVITHEEWNAFHTWEKHSLNYSAFAVNFMTPAEIKREFSKPIRLDEETEKELEK